MQHRRIRSDDGAGIAPTLLLGLGLGLAAGFVLGELYAGEGRRAVKRALPWRKRDENPTASDLSDDLQTRLRELLGPDADTLELVPVGRNAIELHGWVSSRPSRARAIRAARDGLDPAIKLVDRLLVWGEDDGPTAEIPIPEESDAS